MPLGLLQLLFAGYSFSNLVQLIHSNASLNNKVILGIIAQTLKALKNQLLNPQDDLISTGLLATIILPAIKAVMDTKIKNDLSLIKLAGVIQKVITPSGRPGLDSMSSGILSLQLINLLKQLQETDPQTKKLILQLLNQFKLEGILDIETNDILNS